jgi:hypothetical protein
VDARGWRRGRGIFAATDLKSQLLSENAAAKGEHNIGERLALNRHLMSDRTAKHN